MKRGLPATPVLWVAVTILFGATCVELVRYGPLRFGKPATVVSYSEARPNQPLLMLLARVDQAIPAGATFAVVPPTGQDPSNWQEYMIAVGQLPGHRVLFATRFLAAGPPGEAPRFVACPRRDAFVDPRYRLIRRFPEGGLYEAVP